MKKTYLEVKPLSDGLHAKLEGKANFIEKFNQQTSELSVPAYSLETEKSELQAQLNEKAELDARFAEITELIRQMKLSIEQTIAEKINKKDIKSSKFVRMEAYKDLEKTR